MRSQMVVLTTAALLLSAPGCGEDGSSEGSGGLISVNDATGNTDDTGVSAGDAVTGGAADAGSSGADGASGSADAGATATTDGGASGGEDGGASGGKDAGGQSDCPGAAGCACSKNADCDAGACLETPDGKVCAKTCVDSCPAGYECKTFGSSDVVFVCVPRWTSLCSPCAKDGDCKVDGSEARCLDYGAAGKFCGADCKADTDCPSGYSCSESFDKDAGKSFKQCRLADKTAQCSCNKWATKAGYTTTCSVKNDIGTCTAERKCTATGLSPCEAATPKTEQCNKLDDDCDGQTDVLAKDAVCSVAGKLPDGTEAVCPGTPVCKDGKQVCEGAQAPKPEECDLKDNDCDGKTDEDFVWTDPVSKKTASIGAFCGLGPCAGGKVACKSASEAMCDSEKAAKKESCDGVDNDCNGVTDDDTCDDGDACTVDACDASSSKCSNKPGADCDDKNPCTADSCDKAKGDCINKAIQQGSCEDGDACTVGDTCKAEGDKGVCAPGQESKKCDDGNVCTDDSCDKEKGCVNLANTATQSCYTGAQGTEGKGSCTSGTQTCKDGKLGATCVGEVKPSAKEACDNKDDNCDGTTDEGCAITAATASFGSGFGQAKPTDNKGKTSVWYDIGGVFVGRSTPTDGKNKSAEFGFIYWLMSQWK